MIRYSREALGQVVRDLRALRGLTQEELGKRAGYRTGAGVSISRLENGHVSPSRERFIGTAEALGLTADELAARAAEQTPDGGGTSPPTVGETEATSGERQEVQMVADITKDLRARARAVQHEAEERARVVTRLGSEFNLQHDRARDEFFMRLVEFAANVDGAPQPDPTHLQDGDATDAETVAAYRLQSNASQVAQLLAVGAGGALAGAAVGGAAAYGTFVAAASLGTASTGAAIAGLSGAAATNATLALLGGGTLAAGGAGVAGGTTLLASIAATPLVLLSLGGLLLMAKRNRRQQQELAAQLDEAEAELAATKRGYDALQDVLGRAADTLDYIATHAGHALNRWTDQLGSGPLAWDSLARSDQQRYQGFIDIAAAQLAIVTLNVQGLLTTRGSDQDELVQFADQVLTQSLSTVRAHV